MNHLNPQKQQILAGIMRNLPEKALRSLDMALGLTRDEALLEVAGMVTGEIDRRLLRETVFLPYMPLFSARSDGLESVVLPGWILDCVWMTLEESEPQLCNDARQAMRGLSASEATPIPFFHLVNSASKLCRETPEAILRGRKSPEDREAVILFGRYLCLHRLTRKLLHNLPDYLVRMDADRQMSLHLMFRDAHEVTEDGGQLFMELLFAHVSDADDMLRFAAAVSTKTTDRFLAESEMGFVGERLLAAMDLRLAEIKRLGGRKGQPCEDIYSLGYEITDLLKLTQAFDNHVDVTRDGPWGVRLAAAHKTIAEIIAAQLKTAEDVFDKLLPVRSERVYGTVRRETPDVEKPPEADRAQYALDLVRFISAMRPVAASGGFSAQHSKVAQALESELDSYFEALLAIANGDAPFESEVLMGWFDLMADLVEGLCGQSKGHLIRRRTVASNVNTPPKARQHAS